jgi:hypothetical protein
MFPASCRKLQVIFAAGGGTGIEERGASTKRIDPVKHGYDGPPPRSVMK